MYSFTLMVFEVHVIIRREYLAPGACDPVNVDCKVAETVRRRITEDPDRYCFEQAEVNGAEICYTLNFIASWINMHVVALQWLNVSSRFVYFGPQKMSHLLNFRKGFYFFIWLNLQSKNVLKEKAHIFLAISFYGSCTCIVKV